MKRKILYTPGSKTETPKKEKKSTSKPEPKPSSEPPKKPIKSRSKSVCDWLDDHPFFKTAGMCKQLGIDSANFWRYVGLEAIPEKYLDGIVNILKDYGYAE